MIVSKPVHPSPHRTHLSYQELAPSRGILASPPTTPPRGHKHSLSKPMSWLNRSSSSTSHRSAPRAAPKPTRISEPKMSSSLDQLRSGPLGSGATIVRTPQEALSGSAHSLRSNRTSEDDGPKRDVSSHDTEKHESKAPPRSSSPPLPPLPDVADTERGGGRLSGNPPSISLSDHAPPPRSSSLPTGPIQSLPSPRPTLVAQSRAPSRSTPTLPSDPGPNSTPPQPPFEAILLSPVPDGAVDPSKFIVTLETCTTTYRVLLRSLVSRPSHLSHYITFLLSSASETASVYSNSSDISSAQHSNTFSSFFRDHLASSGCLPRSTSSGIHLFLDRPSAPYTHILAYLRSLPGTSERPETLPRAVQLGSTVTPSPSRLESLLELRDEAKYLGLAELEKLCSHDIRRFQCATLQTSTGSGSVHSFHTVMERCPSRPEVLSRPSEIRASKGNRASGSRTPKSTRESSTGSLLESKDALIRERGGQGRAIKHEVGTPPPGWI